MFIVSAAAIVAGTATLLATLETIQNHFRPKPVAPSVPPIALHLSNSSERQVRVAPRGDFMLWLPGPDVRYTTGKYELQFPDGKQTDGEYVTVKPHETVALVAQVLNQSVFGEILERADCDLSLMVQREGRGFKFTENIPFTKSAIKKYFVASDVGTE